MTHIIPTQNLTITNTCQHEIVCMVEELEWSAEALTARELTTLQVFWDLFATEALSPSQELFVGQITVLFTDLKESTAMYEKVGDALGFGGNRVNSRENSIISREIMTSFDIRSIFPVYS